MLKEQAREARENERKKRAIIRERNEAAVKSQYTLIYPLVTYEHEQFIEENFEFEERKLKLEIEKKKQEALDAVGGDKKKLDFDMKRDCFIPDVKEFVFDLEVMRNIKGDLIDKEEKTPE